MRPSVPPKAASEVLATAGVKKFSLYPRPVTAPQLGLDLPKSCPRPARGVGPPREAVVGLSAQCPAGFGRAHRLYVVVVEPRLLGPNLRREPPARQVDGPQRVDVLIPPPSIPRKGGLDPSLVLAVA